MNGIGLESVLASYVCPVGGLPCQGTSARKTANGGSHLLGGTESSKEGTKGILDSREAQGPRRYAQAMRGEYQCSEDAPG